MTFKLIDLVRGNFKTMCTKLNKQNEWMNEWTNEWMNEWMNERMNEWMNEWKNEWMNEWINEWMNEWMNEWLFCPLDIVCSNNKTHQVSDAWKG